MRVIEYGRGRLLFEHSCAKYYDNDPAAAINAMLSVAAGKNSKNLAWSLAYQAIELVGEYFPDKKEEVRAALGNGRYPEPVALEV